MAKIGRRDINRDAWSRLAGAARPMLIGTRDMAGAQAAGGRRGSRSYAPPPSCRLRAEGRRPRPRRDRRAVSAYKSPATSAPRIASKRKPLRRERSTRREMFPRHGRQKKTPAKLRQACRRVGPGVEPVPGEIEVVQDRLGKAFEAKARKDAAEIAAMQNVEA